MNHEAEITYYVIETMMVDGPHWYGGIRKKEKDTAVIQGPEWSPYWEDARKMDKVEAELIFATVCKNMAGCRLIPESEANKKDAWEFTSHEGNPAFMIRAKYMSKGQIVKLPGYGSQYRVVAKDTVEFRLQLCHKNGNLSSNDMVFIGVNAEKRVTVIGEKREVEA